MDEAGRGALCAPAEGAIASRLGTRRGSCPYLRVVRKEAGLRKFMLLATAAALLIAAGPAWPQTKPKPRLPSPVTQSMRNPQGPILPFAVTIGSVTAMPLSITFAANSPGSQIAGGSSATVTWSLTGLGGGTNNNVWTLKVAANTSNFIAGTGSACTSVPTSAVQVSCFSASCPSCGGQGSAGCQGGGPWTLASTAPGQTVATGKEGNKNATFTVTLDYKFADSWTYVANTCPLTVTYTVNAP